MHMALRDRAIEALPRGALREHGSQSEQKVFAGDVGEGRPGGLLGKVADVFDAGAVIEPLLVGVLAPFGQILLRNVPVLEEPFHVMSHRRIAVEPIQDVFGGHVVHDLVIQFLPDVERETGNFTFACRHIGRAHAVNRMEVEKKLCDFRG